MFPPLTEGAQGEKREVSAQSTSVTDPHGCPHPSWAQVLGGYSSTSISS